MKLVQIRPGKSVKVSDTLLEKAARAFEVVALSPSQLKALATAERHYSVLIGKTGTSASSSSRRAASVKISRTGRSGAIGSGGSSSQDAQPAGFVIKRSVKQRKVPA